MITLTEGKKNWHQNFLTTIHTPIISNPSEPFKLVSGKKVARINILHNCVKA